MHGMLIRNKGSAGPSAAIRDRNRGGRGVSEGVERHGAGSGAWLRRPHLTLGRKGVAAFVLLALYVLALGAVISMQRQAIGEIVGELEDVHRVEERLARVNTSLAHTILVVNEASTSGSRVAMSSIALDVEAIEAGLKLLQPHLPVLDTAIGRLERSMALLQSVPLPSSLLELREGLHELVVHMDDATQQVRRRRAALSEDYRRRYANVTLIALAGGFAGFLIFGGMVTFFFTRLARDLGLLGERAVAVIKGYRGDELAVTRHDEVGGLMASVNTMQRELRARERELEVARRREFHEEKMAAFGSLAAAVAHEINNPIAAISGIAEAIDDRCKNAECPAHGGDCHPHLILEQTRRISTITRHLSQFTAAGSADADLVDLNALVQTTCNFLRYDKRLARVRIDLELDAQLPAAWAVPDHVSQVLLNLMLNAADACESCGSEERRILVGTRRAEQAVVLEVGDNGCGMDAATLARAFDEAFTTKPAGKGSGIGLFMCRRLVAEMHGDIRLESQPNCGTRALVTLPLTAPTT